MNVRHTRLDFSFDECNKLIAYYRLDQFITQNNLSFENDRQQIELEADRIAAYLILKPLNHSEAIQIIMNMLMDGYDTNAILFPDLNL